MEEKKEEVKVVEVPRKDGKATRVVIDIGESRFHFFRARRKRINFKKSDPECWVSDELFHKACRQAAAILYSPHISSNTRVRCDGRLPPVKRTALNPKNGWKRKERILSSRTFRQPSAHRCNKSTANHSLPLPF